MRRFIQNASLVAAGLFVAASAYAAHLEPRPFDPTGVRELFDASKAKGSLVKNSVQNRKSPRRAAEDTKTYFAALQSFHTGYTFNFSGGDVFTYEVGVSIEGTTATLSNMFNLEASGDAAYDVVGTYDPEESTITIATYGDYEHGTFVGTLYNYYELALFAGEVGPSGSFKPADELVLRLSDDNETITAESNFALMSFMPGGQLAGAHKVFKSGVFHIPGDEPWLLSFPEVMDYGKVSQFDHVSTTAKIVNMSNAECEFVVDLTGEGTTVTPDSGVIPALGTQEMTVAMSFDKTGRQEATVEVVNDGESIFLRASADVVANPDYSSIVKGGEMLLVTSAGHPFNMTTYSGHQAAQSTNAMTNDDNSYLIARVIVPEGKIAKFSWGGAANSSVYYAGMPRVLVDGEEWGWKDEGQPFYWDGNMSFLQGIGIDISGDVLLASGDHEIKFNYYSYSERYGQDTDKMWVWDLDMTLQDAEEYNASLKDSEANAGYFIYEGNPVESEVRVRITNLGTKELTLTGSVDSEHFSVQPSAATAAILKDLDVTVAFKADAVAEYDEEVTVCTSAGDFTIPCKAMIREMPDYSQIVKEGDFTFSASAQYPFVIVDGKAQNCTAKVADETATESWFEADFTVPSGFLGHVSWKGWVSSKDSMSGLGQFVDYGGFDIWSEKGNGGSKMWDGEEDMSWDSVTFPEKMTVLPGTGYARFYYRQGGDGICAGEDRLQIWDLALTLEPLEANALELSADEVTFGTIYEGKESKAVISITNWGENPIEVYEVIGDDNFTADKPDIRWPILYNNSIDVTLWYRPSTAGDHEGTVTLRTNAGDLVVNCSGSAMSRDGYVLLEDFEDAVLDWIFIDSDGDWYNWRTADMLFWEADMAEICHSGVNCIGSASATSYLDPLYPDNWALSPEFTVPEANAELTWWVAGFWDERLDTDYYEVYISEADRVMDGIDENNYISMAFDTAGSTEWEQRSIDLSEWAGKKVHVAFRHFDSTDGYVLLIDDVFVKGDNVTGADMTGADNGVKEVRWYNAAGVRVASPSNGIFVKETLLNNGTRKVEKKVFD